MRVLNPFEIWICSENRLPSVLPEPVQWPFIVRQAHHERHLPHRSFRPDVLEEERKRRDVGEGVAEGEVVRWLVAEGAEVKEDDPLVEILTDKANVEIPSPVTGTVVKIIAMPGQVVKVGELLALIEPAAGQAVAAGAMRARSSPTFTI